MRLVERGSFQRGNPLAEENAGSDLLEVGEFGNPAMRVGEGMSATTRTIR